ncbi:MAG: UvrD-helicase domain-containing protein, partial [Comamonas sp.]
MTTTINPPPPGLPRPLDPLTLPLHGSRLIEASAGTGKTYTIASLYLRLILGHGGEAAFARPLTPPEILVVTFTEAATQELRERIRARLAQAAGRFDDWAGQAGTDPVADPADPIGDTGDALLDGLRRAYAPAQWPACARRLRLAAEWMDEAAVSTIHGWCYRMLREHAFDSGSLFELTLISDEQELLAQAVRDYWRRSFYGLPAAAAARVLACFKGPDALAEVLRPLLARREARFTAQGQALTEVPEVGVLLAGAEQWAQDEQQLEARARQIWHDDAPALRDLLVALRPDLSAVRFPEKKTDADFDAWLAALAHWAAAGEAAEGLRPERLATGRLKLNGKKPVPEHPVWDALAALEAHRQQPPDLAPGLTLHALREVARLLAQAKQRRAELGFDDLLVRLDDALATPPGGARLAAAIRQRFPVALIDEFQDTDPLQYRIFERIYAPPPDLTDATDGEDAPAEPTPTPVAWLMIGDPKQAIYSFRGADIHTYLRARAATTGRHHTLGTNHRSTAAMVGAVNHAFSQAEHHPAGAFRFARPGHGNPVPFVPVAARGRAEALEIDGQPAAALTAWLLRGERDDAPVGMTTYRREMAERSASAIARWLAPAAAGRSGFRAAGGGWTP